MACIFYNMPYVFFALVFSFSGNVKKAIFADKHGEF